MMNWVRPASAGSVGISEKGEGMSDTPTKRRNGRGLKWALGLSLALNLIIVGFIGGAAWRFAGPDAPDHRWRNAPESYGTAFVRALPPRAQRQLHRSLRQEAGTLPTRGERRALYEEMVSLLRAEPFDETAIQAIFARQAETAQRIQSRGQAAWLDIVRQMDAKERAQVADRLEEVLARGFRRPKRKP